MLQELLDKGDQQATLDPEDQLVLKETQVQLDQLEFQDSVEQKEIRFVPCCYQHASLHTYICIYNIYYMYLAIIYVHKVMLYPMIAGS